MKKIVQILTWVSSAVYLLFTALLGYIFFMSAAYQARAINLLHGILSTKLQFTADYLYLLIPLSMLLFVVFRVIFRCKAGFRWLVAELLWPAANCIAFLIVPPQFYHVAVYMQYRATSIPLNVTALSYVVFAFTAVISVLAFLIPRKQYLR